MKNSFDYVVVGAGSAGCVIASRLTEDPSVRVALLEAGGSDAVPEVSVPITFPRLFKTGLDWDFTSEPEPALAGRRIYLPRGKMLGGSSSMNAMVYIRGNPVDFDEWSAAGAAGWSWREMLPYFRKAESNGRGGSDLHGDRGPLSVTDGRSLHPLADRFVAAGMAAGLARNDDFNDARQFGVGRYQVTQRSGARCSAAVAYLRPALQRPNLQVFTDTQAQRIAIDGRRATGVVVTHHGQQQTMTAAREVIVSAGAYGSPQLLLLSGIGPSADLAPLGIPSTLELPVGEGLQDHPLVLLCYLTDEPSLFRAGTEADFHEYGTHQSGPLTSNLCEAGGFFATHTGMRVPDIQLQMAPVMYVDEALSAPCDDAFSFGPCLLKPTSRGKVSLRSARWDAKPRIVNNFLATGEDRRSMIDGLRHAMRIADQAPLVEVRRDILKAPASDRDEDLWAFVQRELCSNYHPVGTCGIGRVVDPHLSVLGIDGLRVADASVMPSIIRGNTNAAVIAIAEKAVDLLTR